MFICIAFISIGSENPIGRMINKIVIYEKFSDLISV